MDLRITIADENGYVLDHIVVYQDGGDGEGSNRIRELIEDNFDVDDEYDYKPESPIEGKGYY